MTARTEIINKPFEVYSFKSYLEIGVRVPAENFDKINASFKESVDPSPMGTCTYVTTSDDFFRNHVNGKMYDVIFVDGLHTAEQSYKDVQNAIKHLNEGGFIVMHDCNPPTEYHTRSYEEYLATRGEWNGTVFRAFIQLKYELNDWCCFVVDEDFGCGVLTKRRLIKEITPKLNPYNFTWKEFNEKRKEMLELITFDEYLKLLNT